MWPNIIIKKEAEELSNLCNLYLPNNYKCTCKPNGKSGQNTACGLKCSTQPANNCRQVLVNFGLNRKKVFTLQKGENNLCDVFCKHVANEPAFSKLLKGSYVIFQEYSDKFGTWVDVDESVEIPDGAILKAVFFPKIIERDDGCPGLVKCKIEKCTEKKVTRKDIIDVELSSDDEPVNNDTQESSVVSNGQGNDSSEPSGPKKRKLNDQSETKIKGKKKKKQSHLKESGENGETERKTKDCDVQIPEPVWTNINLEQEVEVKTEPIEETSLNNQSVSNTVNSLCSSDSAESPPHENAKKNLKGVSRAKKSSSGSNTAHQHPPRGVTSPVVPSPNNNKSHSIEVNRTEQPVQDSHSGNYSVSSCDKSVNNSMSSNPVTSSYKSQDKNTYSSTSNRPWPSSSRDSNYRWNSNSRGLLPTPSTSNYDYGKQSVEHKNNPVVALSNICYEELVAQPLYSISWRNHGCTCKVRIKGAVYQGSGRSTFEAKNNAAIDALKVLCPKKSWSHITNTRQNSKDYKTYEYQPDKRYKSHEDFGSERYRGSNMVRSPRGRFCGKGRTTFDQH